MYFLVDQLVNENGQTPVNIVVNEIVSTSE